MGKASNRKWVRRYQWPIARLMKLRKAQWCLRRFGNSDVPIGAKSWPTSR